MKTTVKQMFFLNGDEISEKPEEGTSCYRCGQSIGQDDKCAKLATLIAKKDDELIIHWHWFCSECSGKFKKLCEKLR